MISRAFVDNAKVMSKGQVTIPKDVRDVLGVANGDRVSFIVEGNSVRIVNSAVYAMQILQAEMAGEAENAGLTSEEDILAIHYRKFIYTHQLFATMSSDEFKNEQKNNPPRLREGLYTLTLIPSHFVSIQCVFDLFGILSANLHL